MAARFCGEVKGCAVLGLRRRRMTWGPQKLGKENAGAAEVCDPLAGGEHDRSATGARRVDRAAQEEAARAGVHPTVCGGRAEPSVRGFQGWFKTQDGARIDPLTISDAPSRYLLRCQHVQKTDEEHVRAIFESAFRQWGMPEAIRSDNGAPFASRAIAGDFAVVAVVDDVGDRAGADSSTPSSQTTRTKSVRMCPV